MAGLRLVWIKESTLTPDKLAKAAYRKLGDWAFNKHANWIGFIDEKSTKRVNFLAEKLTAAFVGDTPNGAPNISPRVLILHNQAGPADLQPATVKNYHLAHELTFHEDGETYSQVLFHGDPKTTDFQSYFGDYATDESESTINLNRAKRMFAMMLITKCR